MQIPETLNIDFFENQYHKFKDNPESVSREWQLFFNGFEMGMSRGEPPVSPREPSAFVREPAAPSSAGEAQVAELIHRYRDIGHLLACMDPLSACPTEHPLLELGAFGLSAQDLPSSFATPQFSFTRQATLKEILQILRRTYCRSIGVEYMHMQDPEERRWLQERLESNRNQAQLSAQRRRRILEKLTRAALFEQFFNKRYVAVTRFSLEGGDGIIPMFDALLERLSSLGGREVVLGMAHRGRLNVQANILGKPFAEILAEFENCYDSSQLVGSGDVKYHNGYMNTIDMGRGVSLSAVLVNNPSHLEAVDPVVEGIARARQDLRGAEGARQVVPVLIHGDAAFAGQGIVAETLNMSQLAGYSAGGTIHVVINNQIGYTTLPDDARSTRYSTDMAKMLMVPIFHVHGEDPEALVHVIELSADYRYAFGKDVVVDVVCYRRFGHNEGDEPYFTQPQMYDRIRERPSPHKLYADRLAEEGLIDPRRQAELEERLMAEMDAAFSEVHGSSCAFPQQHFFPEAERFTGRYSFEPVDTAIATDRLLELSRRINTLPDDFNPHPKVKQLLQRRLESVEKGEGVDWSNAEQLAFATLLGQGVPIRLSGQDSARGTFSQRHSVLHDRGSGRRHVPLDHVSEQQAPFMVFNSLLAEAGVLGFEYGYSLGRPEVLTLWEAQFGDFINNAQAIVDLFIAGGESKWRRLSGLTLLLPHGWEGLGPEHSSARLERFLQLCADDNLQVCDVSTPAQYFHLLRRQALARYRKPLVLMTPKSLLRHPRAVSSLAQLAQGTFEPVLDDPLQPRKARKGLLCSGKIYYQLLQRREERNSETEAIVRLEQFHPFPKDRLEAVLRGYPRVENWIWVQEAPKNMGAWFFVRPLVEALIGKPLGYVGRAPAASPAPGFPGRYKEQQAAISDAAVGPPTSGAGMLG